MDFKSYVKVLLESEEKAKDEDEKKAKSEEEDEDEDETEEVDSEKDGEASADTGKEPSAKTKCSICGKEQCTCKAACKTKSLKESILETAKYSCGNVDSNVLTEEVRLLVEGIKDNSASKFLAKLAKRAEKDAARYEKKKMGEEAKVSKKAASLLKEASNKLYRCEVRYQNGDVSAKKEYKAICKQYSNELKKMGKTARGIKRAIFTLLAGFVFLGTIGTSLVANEGFNGLIDKINYGFQNKDQMPKILADIAKNDKEFIKTVITNQDGDLTSWSDTKKELQAQAAGWANAAEREKYTEPFRKVKNAVGDFADGFKKPFKAGSEIVGKGLKGAKEGLK